MSRKDYEYNEAAFSGDSPSAMYLLGIIASDGVLEKYHANIDNKALQLLESLRDLVVPEKPIYRDKRTDVRRLKLSHKPIIDFIRSAGITSHKSFTLKVNEWVLESPNFKYFLRGFFDGDGTVGIARNTNGKSKKITIDQLLGFGLLRD